MQDSKYKCGECGTICKHAPGIGHYCPNQDCSIGDGPGLIELDSTEPGGEGMLDHVEDLENGAGCAEVWEHLSGNDGESCVSMGETDIERQLEDANVDPESVIKELEYRSRPDQITP